MVFVGLWGIVNNAGVNQMGFIEWLSIEDMKKGMEINFWGAVRVVKSMLPLVKKTNGRVVNLISFAGKIRARTTDKKCYFCFQSKKTFRRYQIEEKTLV